MIDTPQNVLRGDGQVMAPGSDGAGWLHIGAVLSGRVTRLAYEGIGVDLGSARGFVKREEVSFSLTDDPRHLYRLGDELQAEVVNVSRDGSASLSIRRTLPGWEDALESHRRGAHVEGVVVGSEGMQLVVDLGAVRGIIPHWEISLDVYRLGSMLPAPGTTIRAQVVMINRDAGSVLLSVRRMEAGWSEALDQLHRGEFVDGVVVQVRSDGLAVDTGALFARVMPWDVSLELASGTPVAYAVGDDVRAQVISVDRDDADVRLSIRRAMDDWQQAAASLQPGDVVRGVVVDVRQRGLSLDLGPVEGFVPSAELPAEVADSPHVAYAVGDDMMVELARIDVAKGRAEASIRRADTRIDALLSDLMPDQVWTGKLIELGSAHAHVELGAGVVAIVPREEFSWDDATSAASSFQIGDETQVRIAWVDREHRQVGGSIRQADPDAAGRLISLGESRTVEFKSTLRLDLNSGEQPSASVQNAVLKTIAAFLNSEGGALFIGVADDGTPFARPKNPDSKFKGAKLGPQIEGFKNEDDMLLHLTSLVNKRITSSAWADMESRFIDYHGARVLMVKCGRTAEPRSFVREGNRKVFYVRTGPATQALEIDEAIDYIGRYKNT